MTDWPLSEPNEFGCRVWLDRLDRDGYGVSWKGGKAKRAHVAVWEEANGPVKDGLVLDHLCANRACCRLVHLEPVTQRENTFRRRYAYRARIETCPRGHDMRECVVVVPSTGGGNGRVCRRCNGEGP